MSHSFHDGERAVQARAGVAAIAERVGGSIHAEIPPRAQAFALEQPFAVLASRDKGGGMWASIVCGRPGFLRAPSERTIEIDAAPIPGDPLATNLVAGAPLGALVIDLGTRRRMRVNGRLERAAPPFRIAVDEVFANCPKYIQRRDVVMEWGRALGDPNARVADALTTAQQLRIGEADTFFVASGHRHAGLDASHRGGAPGFVKVLGERRIAWPDYPGNAMFQTLGNLATDPRAGLVFVDFTSGDVLQLSGRAWVDWDPGRAATLVGAERVVEFEIDVVREMRGTLPLSSHGA